jgi:hypothetical protein
MSCGCVWCAHITPVIVTQKSSLKTFALMVPFRKLCRDYLFAGRKGQGQRAGTARVSRRRSRIAASASGMVHVSGCTRCSNKVHMAHISGTHPHCWPVPHRLRTVTSLWMRRCPKSSASRPANSNARRGGQSASSLLTRRRRFLRMLCLRLASCRYGHVVWAIVADLVIDICMAVTSCASTLPTRVPSSSLAPSPPARSGSAFRRCAS